MSKLSPDYSNVLAAFYQVCGVSMPHSVDLGDFRNTLRQLFIDDQNRLNGWVITCPQSNENLQSLSVNIRKHLIKIEGIYGQKDSAESEKLFRDMLGKVCNKLRENNDLNKSCMRCDPPKVAKVVRRRFAGILAHVGEIHLTADEYIRYKIIGHPYLPSKALFTQMPDYPIFP